MDKSEQNRRPAYRDLAADLYNAIVKGWYAPDSRMPTEEALCAATGLSKGTVRAALDTLEDTGVLRRVRGSGIYVEPEFQLNRLHYAAGAVARLYDDLAGLEDYPTAVYRQFVWQRRRLTPRRGVTRTAFIDCTPELFRSIRRQLERADHDADCHFIDDVRLRGRVPTGDFAYWLTPRTHFPELRQTAARHGTRLEWVELSLNAETIRRLLPIGESQLVGVVYETENFFRNVRYSLQMLGKLNGLYRCPVGEWRERLQLADTMDIVFVVPPTLEEDVQDGGRLLAHLEGLDKTAIPFGYEIDRGSILRLHHLVPRSQGGEEDG